MKIKTVYFDMDGVLTDFRGHCEKVFLNNPFKQTNFHEWLAHQVYSGTMFEEIAPNPNLSAMINLICDIKITGNYGVGILSSLGNRMPMGQKRLIKQKDTWLKKYDLYDYFDEIIYVESCDDKRYHAMNLLRDAEDDESTFRWELARSPDSFVKSASSINFLIDDRSHLVDQFNKTGGLAYHYDIKRHKSSEAVIRAILNV